MTKQPQMKLPAGFEDFNAANVSEYIGDLASGLMLLAQSQRLIFMAEMLAVVVQEANRVRRGEGPTQRIGIKLPGAAVN